MNTIYCPTKDKEVCFKQTIIDAGIFENPNEKVFGRIKCYDADYNCDIEKCPLRKNVS